MYPSLPSALAFCPGIVNAAYSIRCLGVLANSLDKSLTSKRWNAFFWSFIAFNTITSLIDAAAIFPQCTPVELNWDKSIPGHCWSNTAINALGLTQGSMIAGFSFSPRIPNSRVYANRFSAISYCCCHRYHLVYSPRYIPLESPDLLEDQTGRLRTYGFGLCVSCFQRERILCILLTYIRSGGFAIARTVLVPSLTASHDPTCTSCTFSQSVFLKLILLIYRGSRTTFQMGNVSLSLPPSIRSTLNLNSLHTQTKKADSKQPSA